MAILRCRGKSVNLAAVDATLKKVRLLIPQAIGKEEATLWRSLPTEYREPLVLFYRQEQSVGEVANSLDLSEDALIDPR